MPEKVIIGEILFKFYKKSNELLINRVIQKSCISASEWGTEAGSVTVEYTQGASPRHPEETIYFHADHPFAFVIGEETSGTILFTGVVDLKDSQDKTSSCFQGHPSG